METSVENIKMEAYTTYKDSGVEWIGQVPENWNLLRGNYVFKVINERSKKGNEELLSVSEHHGVRPRSESNVNMFMAESYEGYKLCRQGDLVINSLWAWSRGLGISKYDGIISTAYSVYRPDHNRYDKDFLNYLLRTENYVAQYVIASKGIWISRLQLSDWSFLRLPILAPSKSEQTRIATFLDQKTAQIHQAIAQKERLIELLKERRQILIHNAVTRGLDPNVRMKDSGVEWIGMVPEHWRAKPLRAIGKCQNGISKSADYFGSGFPFVSYGDVYKNIMLPSEASGLAASTDSDRTFYSVQEGDVFFTRTSETVEEIGFASTCMETIENATFSGFLIRFRPDSDIAKEFSKYYFSSRTHRAFFVKEMNLVIRASLSQELLKRLPVLLPPMKEQINIANYLDNITVKIATAITLKEREIERLKEYKVTLINSAVTGKIKI